MARLYERRAKFTPLFVGSRSDTADLRVELRAPKEHLTFSMTVGEALRIAEDLVSAAAEHEHQRAVDSVAAMVDALTTDEAGELD